MRSVQTCVAVAWFALPTLTALAQPRPAPGHSTVREFRVDAAHSELAFSIRFLHSKVRGTFSGIRGVVSYDTVVRTRSSATVAIDVRSLHTGSAHRDEHLLSNDFFDAARYPLIVFEGRRVTNGPRGDVISGPLTMHGVTREIAIPFQLLYDEADPHGSRIVGFAGSITLARRDFGIAGGSAHNPWFDRVRAATMGDSVEITIELDLWDTDYDRRPDAQRDSAVARIEREGVRATVDRARALRARDSTAFSDSEWDVDQIGRALIARRRPADALAVFLLNSELHPRSTLAWTSVGNAHEILADRAAARRAYERALAIDAYDPRALERLRRLGT